MGKKKGLDGPNTTRDQKKGADIKRKVLKPWGGTEPRRRSEEGEKGGTTRVKQVGKKTRPRGGSECTRRTRKGRPPQQRRASPEQELAKKKSQRKNRGHSEKTANFGRDSKKRKQPGKKREKGERKGVTFDYKPAVKKKKKSTGGDPWGEWWKGGSAYGCKRTFARKKGYTGF